MERTRRLQEGGSHRRRRRARRGRSTHVGESTRAGAVLLRRSARRLRPDRRPQLRVGVVHRPRRRPGSRPGGCRALSGRPAFCLLPFCLLPSAFCLDTTLTAVSWPPLCSLARNRPVGGAATTVLSTGCATSERRGSCTGCPQAAHSSPSPPSSRRSPPALAPCSRQPRASCPSRRTRCSLRVSPPASPAPTPCNPAQ